MKIKSIRGTIKYNGIVYAEGQIFDIEDKDFIQLQENAEIVSENEKSEDTVSNKSEYEDEEVDEVDGGDTINNDLDTLNVAELKKIAKEQGIKLADKMTKSEIIQAIQEGK